MNAAKTGDVSAIQLLAMSGVDFTGILTIVSICMYSQCLFYDIECVCILRC